MDVAAIAKIDSKKKYFASLKYLDATLEERTFLVNDRFGLADVAVFTALLPLYRVDAQLKSVENLFVHLTRWFFTVLNLSLIHI